MSRINFENFNNHVDYINLDFLMKKLKKLNKKSRKDVDNFSFELANTYRVFSAFSSQIFMIYVILMDIYSLGRMMRFPSDIKINYSGLFHTQNYVEFFEKYMKYRKVEQFNSRSSFLYDPSSPQNYMNTKDVSRCLYPDKPIRFPLTEKGLNKITQE